LCSLEIPAGLRLCGQRLGQRGLCLLFLSRLYRVLERLLGNRDAA
jgi:hypothetical protein